MELVEGDTPNTGHEFVSGIVPISADNYQRPTLAVRTPHQITGYQIGGVRPSLPTKGLVWGLVENSRITSLQIYNGQAWEECDGRIWTGSRWVPYYAYDVVLLKDMYDIIESDPTQEYIYTQQGFWAWLQRAWGQMIARLDAIIDALGGQSPPGDTSGDGDTSTDPGTGPGDDSESILAWLFDLLGNLIKTVVVTVVDLLSDFVGFFFGLLDSTLLEGLRSWFGWFTPQNEYLIPLEGVDIWAY